MAFYQTNLPEDISRATTMTASGPVFLHHTMKDAAAGWLDALWKRVAGSHRRAVGESPPAGLANEAPIKSPGMSDVCATWFEVQHKKVPPGFCCIAVQIDDGIAAKMKDGVLC